MTLLLPGDLAVTTVLQNLQAPWLTTLMLLISWVTTPELWSVVLLAVGLWLYERRRYAESVFLLMLTLGNLLGIILKYVIHRARPSDALVQVLTYAPGQSFPSGHAMGIMLLVGGFLAFLPSSLRRHRNAVILLSLILIVLVGISRIYLGVHWISDVIAGYVFGLLWLFLTRALIPRLARVERVA